MRLDLLCHWFRRIVWIDLWLGLFWLVFVLLKPGPQDMPWTALRLNAPIGAFTGRKLVALRHEPAKCRALLRDTGIAFEPVPPHGSGRCRIADAIHVAAGQQMLSLSPASVAPSCPVMSGLLVWQWQVVQPAAQRIFGASVKRIEHYGSYSCRRMYGRQSKPWSEHATADAIDVSGFVLTDGTTVSVARDWSADDRKGHFLHVIRDGACGLFSTVLSPDYNAAHRNHFHLDQAARGEWGGRACR
jgi:hypothetical protein